MNDVAIIETIAIIVGLVVIAIETLIIYFLHRHSKILDRNLENSQSIMAEFRRSIYEHLYHLNEHSHGIEQRLESLLLKISTEFNYRERIQQTLKNGEKEGTKQNAQTKPLQKS